MNQSLLVVPFPHGKCHSLNQIQLQYPSGEIVALQKKITSRWPDKSIKWALIDFQAVLKANEILHLDLLCLEKKSVPAPDSTPKGIVLEETEQIFTVNTGAATFTVNKQQFTVIDQVSVTGKKQVK